MTAYLFDTETTRLHPEIHQQEDGTQVIMKPVEAIELAYSGLEFDPERKAYPHPVFRVFNSLNQLYKPHHPMTIASMATHLIIPQDLESCPPSSTAKLPDDCDLIIGHNVLFDASVLGIDPSMPFLDTVILAQMAYGDKIEDFKLSTIAMTLASKDPDQLANMRDHLRQAHRASADVATTIAVFESIVRTLEAKHQCVFSSFQALVDLQNQWLKSEQNCIQYGKHAKKPYRRLPDDYLSWMLKNIYTTELSRLYSQEFSVLEAVAKERKIAIPKSIPFVFDANARPTQTNTVSTTKDDAPFEDAEKAVSQENPFEFSDVPFPDVSNRDVAFGFASNQEPQHHHEPATIEKIEQPATQLKTEKTVEQQDQSKQAQPLQESKKGISRSSFRFT